MQYGTFNLAPQRNPADGEGRIIGTSSSRSGSRKRSASTSPGSPSIISPT